MASGVFGSTSPQIAGHSALHAAALVEAAHRPVEIHDVIQVICFGGVLSIFECPVFLNIEANKQPSDIPKCDTSASSAYKKLCPPAASQDHVHNCFLRLLPLIHNRL